MSLAYVQAIAITVLALIGTWSGLLVSVAFLLPRQARKAEEALGNSPWICFGGGLGLTIMLIIGLVLVQAPLPPVKFIGFVLMLALGSIMTLGASGAAQLIGKRGGALTHNPSFGTVVRGSVVFSLAVGFPLLGWFVFAPLSLIFAMGAGAMALVPTLQTVMTPPNPPPGVPDFDVANGRGLS